MNFAVFLTTYSHNVGLVIQLLHQAIELDKIAAPAGVSVHMASVHMEQNPGLWDLARRHFPPERLIVLEDEDAALRRAAEQFLERQGRVVFHVQGNRQLNAIRHLRLRHPDRVRIVYSVHSFRNASWKRVPFSWAASRLLRRYADYTIFCSPHAIETFVNSRKIIRGGRGGMMIQGIERWSPEAAPELLSAQLSTEFRNLLLEPMRCRFLYLTRELTARGGKGHDWMLEGAAPVLRQHRHACVIIAGRGDQATFAAVRARARQLDVERQIVLPGWIDRRVLAWVIAHCEAGIVASRSETFGHAYIEPMMLGKPVIGTRVGVACWLIMDYFTGIGFEQRDHRGLQRSMEYIIMNPADAARMGRNAEKIVRDLFCWENVASSHFGIYRSLWL